MIFQNTERQAKNNTKMKNIPFNCLNTLTVSIVTALNKDRVSLSETAFHFTKQKLEKKLA